MRDEGIDCNYIIVLILGSGEEGGLGAELTMHSRRNNLRLQETAPKTLSLEVLSSHERVAVTVDGATVS